MIHLDSDTEASSDNVSISSADEEVDILELGTVELMLAHVEKPFVTLKVMGIDVTRLCKTVCSNSRL